MNPRGGSVWTGMGGQYHRNIHAMLDSVEIEIAFYAHVVLNYADGYV